MCVWVSEHLALPSLALALSAKVRTLANALALALPVVLPVASLALPVVLPVAFELLASGLLGLAFGAMASKNRIGSELGGLDRTWLQCWLLLVSS